MKNYTKFAVRGAAIIFTISILSAFLGYLVRFVLARNLSVEDFGLFYAVFSFLGLLGIFKTLGFDKSLIKFIPELMQKKKYDLIKSSIIFVAMIQLVTNSVIMIGIYLTSGYLSDNFFHNSNAKIILNLMVIAFFIDSFVFIIKFSFQGFQKMIHYSGIDLVRMSLIFTISLIGFKYKQGILSPVAAYIITPIILILLFKPILTKKIFLNYKKSKFTYDKKYFKKLSNYSIFIMATGVGAVILGYTDSIVLTYFSGVKEVGLYNVALPTARVLTFFPLAVMGVLLPLTSELWVKKKINILRAGMESLYKYSIIIILPIILIMVSFTELLIGLLYGKNYVLASSAMKILSVGMLFATLYGINGSFLSGIGKPKINSNIVYTAAIFNLVTNIILIPKYGIIGAAITTTIGYFIMMSLGLIKIKKIIRLGIPFVMWAKTLLSGIFFVISIWALKKVIVLNVWAEMFLVLSISGLIYGSFIFIFKVLNIEELKDLYKRVR